MNLSKIKAYIGFAIKSKAIVYGVDSIKEKNVKVIFFTSSLSDSSKHVCENMANKFSCNCYEVSDSEMLDLTASDKIKAFAILNNDLAKAIENNM